METPVKSARRGRLSAPQGDDDPATTVTPCLAAPGLRAVRLDYAADVSMPLHTHDSEASLALCLSGAAEVTWNRVAHTQGRSAVSFMPRGTAHANRFPRGVRLFVVALEPAHGEKLGMVYPWMDIPFLSDSGRSSWLATRMYHESRRSDDLTGLILEGLLVELIAEMGRAQGLALRGSAPAWLRHAVDYLHARFTRGVTSESLASAVGVHPSHLMRTFHCYQGCTVGGYVRRLRVEYAYHLLTTTDHPLSQIARDAGFADQSHFNRTFKDRFGANPLAYRQQTEADS